MKVKIKKVPKAQQGISIPNTDNSLQIEGPFQQLTPDVIKLNGNRHSQGGQNIAYGGTPVEAEGTELLLNRQNGNGVTVLGNVLMPGTNKTFKSIGEDLANKQFKANNYANIGSELVNNNDPYDKWQSLKFNAGRAMLEGGRGKVQELKDNMEHLANVQQAFLSVADDLGAEPIPLSKGKIVPTKENIAQYKSGGNLPTAQNGKNIPSLQQIAREEAYRYNVDPDIFIRQIQAESGFNPNSKGAKGISGIAQLSSDERSKYGISSSEATSSNPDAIRKNLNAAAQIMASNLKANSGDYGLALAQYNGGRGSLTGAKKWASDNNKPFNSNTWLQYQKYRQEKFPTDVPSAWQNETYNYVNSIIGGKGVDKFHKQYYSNPTPNTTNQSTPVSLPKVSGNDVASTFPSSPTTLTGNPGLVVNDIPQNTVQNNNNNPIGNYGFTPSKHIVKDIPFQATQILPELYALGQNNTQGVFQQNYQPDLYTPYQVSFQDRINDNNQTFNALRQNAYIGDNPTALATMAGQLYDANNRVRADEFRTNQGISNDITNKNIALLNEAQRTNLALQDQAYVRQNQAASNTRELNYGLMNSITSKINQWQVENEAYKRQQLLYDYTYNGNGYETSDPDAFAKNMQSVFQSNPLLYSQMIQQPNTTTTSTYSGNSTTPDKRVVKSTNK